MNALTVIQQWNKDGYVDPNTNGDAFEEGRSPISWIGHWFYDRYTNAFPGDVELVPLPNFGNGVATASGSWQWGITSNATDGDAVWRFLEFLLSSSGGRPDDAVQTAAIPATSSAVRISPSFGPGGPEHLYIQQLEDGVARPRPQTPVYPALSDAFAHAFKEVCCPGTARQGLARCGRAAGRRRTS